MEKPKFGSILRWPANIISQGHYDILFAQAEEVARLLVFVMSNPEKFLTNKK